MKWQNRATSTQSPAQLFFSAIKQPKSVTYNFLSRPFTPSGAKRTPAPLLDAPTHYRKKNNPSAPVHLEAALLFNFFIYPYNLGASECSKKGAWARIQILLPSVRVLNAPRIIGVGRKILLVQLSVWQNCSVYVRQHAWTNFVLLRAVSLFEFFLRLPPDEFGTLWP